MTASDSRNLIALPAGFRLGEYRIERYLGSGGFGITYAAIDENLNRRLAIKEYLPKAFAMRGADDQVTVATAEDEADFRWGLDRFLDEARTLARFDHPNIVSVERFVEAHGTAYIVMEHVDGESLSDLLRRKRTLTEGEIREHVLPVANGLAEVHRAGLLHRDIKPGNIVVRATNGVPVLIDFGSARHEASAKSRSLTAVITPGYAPLEQYSSSLGDERPATDIYAFGAVLYRCVTGDSPPDATDRALDDRLTSAVEAADGIYSPGLLTATDAALRMRADERPRDIAAFLQMVSTADIRGERPEDAGVHRLVHVVGHGLVDIRGERLEDAGASHAETSHAPGAGPGLGRTGRNVAHSNEVGSSADREKSGRWELWGPAMTIAVILGAFALDIFLHLRGGDLEPSSDWRPVPAVTSETPSLGEPPRGVLPVAEREPVDSAPSSSFTVEVEPPHARVRIMNIVPVYEPGIMLAAGSYTVEVGAAGYETVTEAVMHDATTPTVHRVALFGQLAINATTKGRLESLDREIDDGRFVDYWKVRVPAGPAGQTLTIDMSSGDFDAVLVVTSAQDSEFARSDRAGDHVDAELEVMTEFSGMDTVARVSADVPQQGGEYLMAATSGAAGEVGAYELRVDVPSRAPLAGGKVDSVLSPTFTRGSHEDDVLRVQGTPTAINVYEASETWWYGSSSVEISKLLRRVTEWSNRDRNLKVQMEPGPNTTNSVAFTHGSHEDDVLRVQGTPTAINVYEASETWWYGSSSVEISKLLRRVTEWSNRDRNLKVQMEPGPNTTNSVAFTRGSHEDDVLRVQGTPTAIDVDVYGASETWWYGSSSVEISKLSRWVTEWSNRDRNLKVR